MGENKINNGDIKNYNSYISPEIHERDPGLLRHPSSYSESINNNISGIRKTFNKKLTLEEKMKRVDKIKSKMKNKEKLIAEEYFNKRNTLPEVIKQSKDESKSIYALLTLNNSNGRSTDSGTNRLAEISIEQKKVDFVSPMSSSSIELPAAMEEE
ncbi:hypothetical protein AYI70_g10969 [Smittium culicis]|uniref:Uncharacterized protein n=1 Tax=Smittium culicis TaxID=133412 RepID=A0A1R1X3X3_9FUNG|nr:hypothetical protein AYI70_g10969 [Smittium culicis]